MSKNSLGLLIISDLHLNKVYEHKKFIFLKNLIEKSDQVIINGDLWSHYIQSFDDFINGPYKELFPLLKRKNCIYIFGNHDKKEWCNGGLNLFSTKAIDEFTYIDGNIDLYITHGHGDKNLLESIDPFIKLNRYYYDFTRINGSYKIYPYLMRWVNRISKKNFWKGKMASINGKLRSKAEKLPKNKILVTGHTHFPEFSIDKKFINTGYINYGLANFVTIKNQQIKYFHGTYDEISKQLNF